MCFTFMASRHTAFYTPFLICIGFLRDEGHQISYSVLGSGQRSYALLRDGELGIMQSAVSSSWRLREQGSEPLPVHFAQINQREGLFIIGRRPEPQFHWKNLEGKELLADHGLQPLVMLKYAVKHNGADWKPNQSHGCRHAPTRWRPHSSAVPQFMYISKVRSWPVKS